jgi:hypothetical protein
MKQEPDQEEELTCDCFLKSAKTCATVLGLDVETCPCPCHERETIDESLPSQS